MFHRRKGWRFWGCARGKRTSLGQLWLCECLCSGQLLAIRPGQASHGYQELLQWSWTAPAHTGSSLPKGGTCVQNHATTLPCPGARLTHPTLFRPVPRLLSPGLPLPDPSQLSTHPPRANQALASLHMSEQPLSHPPKNPPGGHTPKFRPPPSPCPLQSCIKRIFLLAFPRGGSWSKGKAPKTPCKLTGLEDRKQTKTHLDTKERRIVALPRPGKLLGWLPAKCTGRMFNTQQRPFISRSAVFIYRFPTQSSQSSL